MLHVSYPQWLLAFELLLLSDSNNSVVCRYLRVIEHYLITYGVSGSIHRLYRAVAGDFVASTMQLPLVRGAVQKQVDKALDEIDSKFVHRNGLPIHHEIPEKAINPKEISHIMKTLDTIKRSDWENGRLSGAVYHGGHDLLELQTKVYGQYTVANQLHPDCFPAVRHMDAEVVSMVLDLYNGPQGSCGTSTSGGTESLLLTCLAAREKAKAERGVTEPEIIAPVTIHAGFDKAAYYFGMKLIHAPVDKKTGKVSLKAVEKLIGPNTVLLAGSAPNFPHGIIDDIEGLSKIALKHRLPLHVDACLGSFIVPFLRDLGVDAPLFDFRVPGVTSISCDTHKYGFAPKGSSVIMYRTAELCHYQYFVSVDWSGGLYASPTLAGSRPGALMAGCWATLLYMGKDGYRETARAIVSSAQKLKTALRTHPVLAETLSVIGDPLGSVVAFQSKKVNVYDLSDTMSKKGWHLATLQNPASVHLAATRLTIESIDELIADLVASVETLISSGSETVKDGTKALYGVAGSVQTAGIAKALATGFVDALYKT